MREVRLGFLGGNLPCSEEVFPFRDIFSRGGSFFGLTCFVGILEAGLIPGGAREGIGFCLDTLTSLRKSIVCRSKQRAP